jgi:hypothetical protein
MSNINSVVPFNETAVAAMQERRAAARAWQPWARQMLTRQITDRGADDGAFDEHGHGWHDGRFTALVIPCLAAVRLWHTLIDLDHQAMEAALTRAMAFVLRRQRGDGQLDLGGSYSPNEAGFPIPAMVETHRRLGELDSDWAATMRDSLERYIKLAAEAVLAGQAHTANHRWAAAAGPLAAAHSLFPDDRYLQKIESYLADGVDCDEDGCWFEERGVGYNNVANHGMLALAEHLQRPELADHVVRNLQFMLFNTQPSLEGDTSYSFRQDRGRAGQIPCEYTIARRAAILSGDGRITQLALCQGIQAPGNSTLRPLLFEIDNHPGPLPAPEPIPDRYQRVFSRIHVARIRRGRTALTLAADPGNHFFDTVRDQWGGPKRSEDWFCLHHGSLVIQSIHLAVANQQSIQPSTLIPEQEPGLFALTGLAEGWMHSAHFRPGRPGIKMSWDLRSDIRVQWKENRIHLQIECRTPNALAASLIFHVRAGAQINETGHTTVAGERIGLSLPTLTLTKGGDQLQITGLPPAAHQMAINHSASIPTAMGRECARLELGLRLPVELDLTIRLI